MLARCVFLCAALAFASASADAEQTAVTTAKRERRVAPKLVELHELERTTPTEGAVAGTSKSWFENPYAMWNPYSFVALGPMSWWWGNALAMWYWGWGSWYLWTMPWWCLLPVTRATRGMRTAEAIGPPRETTRA